MKNLKRADYNTNVRLVDVEPVPLEQYEEDGYMNIRINDGLKYRLVSFRNQEDGSVLIKFWTGNVGAGYTLNKQSSTHYDDITYRLKRR